LAGSQLHGDVAYAGQPGQLGGDRRGAVAAGHPGDPVGSRGRHSVPPQDRTSRAMASEASLTLAVGSPSRAASATQWARCPSSRPSATAWRARVAAEIWVRTSMQYTSWSIIRCTPRTCPSRRRNRLSRGCLPAWSTPYQYGEVAGVESACSVLLPPCYPPPV